jgi:CheY-like chemotaxis protein
MIQAFVKLLMTVKHRKILLADDDSEDRDMLVDALQGVGLPLEIDTVTNGQEVLDYLFNCSENELPALIILDYKMPFLNAAEVLEAIKDDSQYTGITKIVWSTSRQTEHMNRCRIAGAKQYFVKPSAFHELKDIAEAILKTI